ncbi:3-coathanger stack domain-containing protein [Runella sp.]|uniref:3-coathanger stack domain-containing protein n=1 Tax=Runella sp. TaxID=1960881 RepID=UPI003D0F7518
MTLFLSTIQKVRLLKLKWTIILFFLCSHHFSIFAQNQLYNKVNQARSTTSATRYTLFTRAAVSTNIAVDTAFVAGASITRLVVNKSEVERIASEQKPFIQLSVPVTANQTIELELIPHSIFSPFFKTTNAAGATNPIIDLGSYYHGIIKGDPQSMASISIVNGEMTGLISYKKGNLNLGKEPKSSNYILYNDKDLKNKKDFTCFAKEPTVKAMGQNLLVNPSNVACGSIQVYIEADHQIYMDNGSTIGNTVNYINSVFSKVATLYANEGISVVISEIKVWDTTDPYIGATTSGMALDSFIAKVPPSFNGRLAHLFSGRYIGGGMALLDALCDKSRAYAVSGNMYSYIPDLPFFSWSVMEVAHEMGHSIGSPHTQSCSWPVGALDNCYTPEGECAPGPAPTNGGTIMSYCHLTETGINLANGFGPFPGDLLRAKTQLCLGSAIPPTDLATLEVYDTQALISWKHSVGVYTIEYRPISSVDWISAGTTSAKNLFLTSLTPNTAYEWRISINCSGYVTSTFTTNSTPAPPLYCTTFHSFGCNAGLAINSVQIGDSLLSNFSGCIPGGYGFITSPTQKLVIGQTYNLRVGMAEYYNFGQLAIWIDLNKDYQFQENERVFNTSTGLKEPITGSFTIPIDSPLGKTRMRLILDFSDTPTRPCGPYIYGEAEDYYVDIVHPCEQPITLNSPTDDYITGSILKQTNLTINAANKIGSDTNITYQAGNSITLKAGFQADSGAVFKAHIAGCN